jgi:hypothetical protein
MQDVINILRRRLEQAGAPVTGDLSPFTSVSFFTSLLNTDEVRVHARFTAATATCCSVVSGRDIEILFEGRTAERTEIGDMDFTRLVNVAK